MVGSRHTQVFSSSGAGRRRLLNAEPSRGGVVADTSELHGFEFDWFAMDQSGHVALFSSGGSAQVPAHALALEASYHLLAEDLSIPDGPDSWRRAAEAGFFAYDCDMNGGPYRLEWSPASPITSSQLRAAHRSIVEAVRYRGSFGSQTLDFDPTQWAGQKEFGARPAGGS